jgi:hypothetical protein
MDLTLLRADRLKPRKRLRRLGVPAWEPSIAPVTDTGGGLDVCLERGLRRVRARNAPARLEVKRQPGALPGPRHAVLHTPSEMRTGQLRAGTGCGTARRTKNRPIVGTVKSRPSRCSRRNEGTPASLDQPMVSCSSWSAWAYSAPVQSISPR